MDLSFPHAENIDSTCGATLPDEETDTGVLPRCGDDAVTWFETERGTRLYVCPKHARDPLRFGDPPDDLPDDYNDLKSYAAEQGIRLQSPSREELIRRLTVAPNAADLDENPRVSPCRSCHKPTLMDDLDYVGKRCPACREGVPELDTDEAVLSAEA